MKEPLYPNQVVPLALTVVVFLAGIGLLWGEVHLLNYVIGGTERIVPTLRWQDIAIGLTIYLKTAIDFAIFIGRLMSEYPGWKNRIMIEIGTALGNIAGTIAILLLWDIFREIKWLMAVMIVIAGLVLLRMAEEGLEHVKDETGNYNGPLGQIAKWVEIILQKCNHFFAPVLNKIIPSTKISENKKTSYGALLLLSISVPFILGLDDFAGYIPLFNVVNVFGFATGVFLGHMLLNIALFLSPQLTIKAVKNPIISFFGSIAFIVIAAWGFVEAWHLINSFFFSH
jgi:hypothetical protein